jgi:hypothetical protein
MPRYFCSLPNVKSADRVPELISDDPVAIAAFVKKWDVPGRGVYECVSVLKPGATRRSLETVGELYQVHTDIDLRSLATPSEIVLSRLQGLPLPLELRNSGGGYHVIARLKEPVRAGTPEFDQINQLRKALTRLLCGDPMPDHAAALLRVVGSHNSKYGEPRLCQVIQPGAPIDITEIEELIDLLADRPLFEPLPKTNGRGHTEGGSRFISDNGPITVDERLAGMRFEGPANSAIHITQLQCSAAMLRAGVAADDVVAQVLAATKHAVTDDERCKGWNWDKERLDIERMTYSQVNKNPELATLLPDALYEQWQARLRDEPQITRNASGWYVRATPRRLAGDSSAGIRDEKNAAAEQAKPSTSATRGSRRRSYLPPSLSEVTLEWGAD